MRLYAPPAGYSLIRATTAVTNCKREPGNGVVIRGGFFYVLKEVKMNTKEIASAVNKTERSVQRWVKKAGDKMSSISDKMSSSTSTKPSDFDLDETLLIIETGLGKNAAAVYASNAKDLQKPSDSLLSQKEIEMITKIVSVTVAETIKQLDGRMTNIEQKIEERKALLPAPEIAPRDRINMIIRDYAERNRMPFAAAYSELYKIFNYTYGCNVNASAKHRGVAIIEYIESEGLIENLESVAVSRFSPRMA
jgi:hypothetical protein